MPLVEIDSIDDPRLEHYRNLKDTNRTRWAGLFVVEGEKLVRRLIASDYEVSSVLVARKFLDRLPDGAPSEAPVYVIPDDAVDRLVGFNFHRGMLACGRRKPSPSPEQLVGGRERVTLVVCPDVQDPENLGAILRISSAFGVDGVLVGAQSADPFSRRVLRVSMGAALAVPVLRSENLAGDLMDLRDRWQVELAATVLDPSAEPLDRAARPPRFALLLGSEGHGLSPQWIDLCQRRLTIPMAPGVDSLNVAIAAGIFLYRLAKP